MPTTEFERATLDDLSDGLLIPLVEVPTWIEQLTGQRVSHQAVWNWTKQGLSIPGGRTVLRSFKRGRKCYVTGRALRLFLLEG